MSAVCLLLLLQAPQAYHFFRHTALKYTGEGIPSLLTEDTVCVSGISVIFGSHSVDKHYCRSIWGLFPFKCDTSLLQDKTLTCFLTEEGICLIFPKRL